MSVIKWVVVEVIHFSLYQKGFVNSDLDRLCSGIDLCSVKIRRVQWLCWVGVACFESRPQKSHVSFSICQLSSQNTVILKFSQG